MAHRLKPEDVPTPVRDPEDVRALLGWTQAAFAKALGMPFRTYQDKVRKGFRQVDLMAAKWLYCQETGGGELISAEVSAKDWLLKRAA